MQIICTSLQTDCQDVVTQIFAGRMLFLTPNQQCQSTEGLLDIPVLSTKERLAGVFHGCCCSVVSFNHKPAEMIFICRTVVRTSSDAVWMKLYTLFTRECGTSRKDSYRLLQSALGLGAWRPWMSEAPVHWITWTPSSSVATRGSSGSTNRGLKPQGPVQHQRKNWPAEQNSLNEKRTWSDCWNFT